MEDKPYYKMDIQETINQLKSSRSGISEEDAIKRRSEYGLNQLPQAKKISLLKLFLEQFKDILVIILIVAILIELLVILLGYEDKFTNVIAISVFIMINSVVGFVSEYRSEKSMLALKQITADTARIVRPEGEYMIDSKLLVPGDIIHLTMGDKVPADVQLIDVMNLRVDESNLTGESKPVKKQIEAITKDAALGDRLNMVHSGTIVTYGRGLGIVIATGIKTQIGKIAQLLTEIEEAETPLQKKMSKVGSQLGILIVVICILVFVIGILKTLIIGQTIEPTLIVGFMLTAVALAVAAMPSGLPIVITTLLALGMFEMAHDKALIKRLKAVETLGSVNVICSDKTGTLTKNEMTTRKIFADNKLIDVSGVGYEPIGKFFKENMEPFNPLDDSHFDLLLRIGILCGTTKVEQKGNKWIVVGDPTEGSLHTLAMKAGVNIDKLKEKYPQIGEIPFTSELKRMTTIHKTPENEIYAYIKGALDIILERCTSIYCKGQIYPFTEENRINILKLNGDLSSQQLRILAMAYRRLEDTNPESFESADTDLTFVGLVGMMDPPRDEVPAAIIICKNAGIEIKMITGDHPGTANAIAKEIGLISDKELENTIIGVEFHKKSKKEIENAKVFARISPEHKLQVVETLLAKNNVVAVTGDGVNDAPALKSANIGVAMGIAGTDVAKEAATMTLTDDNFATIVKAVKKGRNIYENILKTIFYLLSCNIGEILIIFVWIIIGINMFSSIATVLPLVPLQILWVNLITDSLPALSLAKEPDDPRIMEFPPRRVDEPVFTRRFTINIILLGTLICIGTLCIFYWGLIRGSQLWITGSETLDQLKIIEGQIYRYATTLAFMTVTFFENWNIFCSRSLKNSIFSIKSRNYYMYLALGVAIILQATVVYIPVLQPVFHTYYLGVIDWVLIIVISSSIIWVTEGYKWMWRKIDKSKEKILDNFTYSM
ncbi:MAG TPA: cation-translocating P-type ATPase [Candidatus Deferrimicrobium sp.]|nr:cation-translocating P-type ATPase [Candidatus Deferrimicrobium sp.]